MTATALRFSIVGIFSILASFAAGAQAASADGAASATVVRESGSQGNQGDQPPPGPTLVGDGLTQFNGIVPNTAFGLFSFSFNVTNLGDTSVKKHISAQSIQFSSNFSNTAIAGIDEISTSLIDVKCLQTSGGSAWWSGTVFFFTPDPRINGATNSQILNDVAHSRYLIGGKIINGVPEKRSVFISGANVPEVSLADAFSIYSVLVPILGQSAGGFCRLHDGMFGGNADFLQLDTIHTGTIQQSTNCVTGHAPNVGEVLCDIQWMQPDDTTPVSVAPNVASTFAHPPAASIYDLSGVTRDFVAGSVVIGP